MRKPILLTLVITAVTAALSPVQPASPSRAERDPFAAKGERASPDRRYLWMVVEGSPLHYVLKDVRTDKKLVQVDSYYGKDAKFTRAAGFYWNATGGVTVLDELNYRRAGEFYVYRVSDGQAMPVDLHRLLPRPPDADEARLTTEPVWDEPSPHPLGWLDGETLSVRWAVRHRNGVIDTQYYLLNFRDPSQPTVSAE